MDRTSFWIELVKLAGIKHHGEEISLEISDDSSKRLDNAVYGHINGMFDENDQQDRISSNEFDGEEIDGPSWWAIAATFILAVGALTFIVSTSNKQLFNIYPATLASYGIERHIVIPNSTRALVGRITSVRSFSFNGGVIRADLDLLGNNDPDKSKVLADWYAEMYAENNSSSISAMESSKSADSTWYEQGYAVEILHLSAKEAISSANVEIVNVALEFYQSVTRKAALTNVPAAYDEKSKELLNLRSISNLSDVQYIIDTTESIKVLAQ